MFRLRVLAGLDGELTESCGNKVEDVVVNEPVNNPGTTIGTKFSILHCILLSFLMRCGN